MNEALEDRLIIWNINSDYFTYSTQLAMLFTLDRNILVSSFLPILLLRFIAVAFLMKNRNSH